MNFSEILKLTTNFPVLNNIDDIYTLDDNFFQENNLSIFYSRIKPKKENFEYIKEININKDNVGGKIFYRIVIESKIIKQQLVNISKFIKENCTNLKILFYNPTRNTLPEFEDEEFLKIITQKHFWLSRWNPGLISNFDEIIKNKNHLLSLSKKLTEQKQNKKKINKRFIKIERNYAKRARNLYTGWENLNTFPEFMFILNPFLTSSQYSEIQSSKKIKLISFINPMCNLTSIQFPIFLNYKTSNSIIFLLKSFLPLLNNLLSLGK